MNTRQSSLLDRLDLLGRACREGGDDHQADVYEASAAEIRRLAAINARLLPAYRNAVSPAEWSAMLAHIEKA